VGRNGGHAGRVVIVELLDEGLDAAEGFLREGVDFTDLKQAARLAERSLPQRRRAVPQWALAAMAALRDLAMLERTGALPGGRACTEQPAWKVELWEAYWRGREMAGENSR
jgi:hypothetical protein